MPEHPHTEKDADVDIAAVSAAHPMLTAAIPEDERIAHEEILRVVDESAAELEKLARRLRAAHVKYQRRQRGVAYREAQIG
jgi:hypothetical protein